MSLFRKHIFICTNERTTDNPRGCCKTRGAEKIRDWFKEEVKNRGLSDVRANQSGCLDQCTAGPVVVVYPDAVWYTVKTQTDVLRIMDEHITNNQPVTDLFLKH